MQPPMAVNIKMQALPNDCCLQSKKPERSKITTQNNNNGTSPLDKQHVQKPLHTRIVILINKLFNLLLFRNKLKPKPNHQNELECAIRKLYKFDNVCHAHTGRSTWTFTVFAILLSVVLFNCPVTGNGEPLALPRTSSRQNAKTLYIAGFFSTSRQIAQGSIGRGVLPAVRLALQHVNESPLFTKYRLDLVWNNTKVSAPLNTCTWRILFSFLSFKNFNSYRENILFFNSFFMFLIVSLILCVCVFQFTIEFFLLVYSFASIGG